MFPQKILQEMWCVSGCTPSWWSCQSPVAHGCSFLNHPGSFHGGLFKPNTRFDADALLYLLSHFEGDGHTVHMLIDMLTQWCWLPPLTSTVKSSLFMHEHSSPLALAARLHQCHTNCSCYINNGWTFSGLTSFIFWILVIALVCGVSVSRGRPFHSVWASLWLLSRFSFSLWFFSSLNMSIRGIYLLSVDVLIKVLWTFWIYFCWFWKILFSFQVILLSCSLSLLGLQLHN